MKIKKMLSVTLAAAMMLSVAGCGSSTTSSDSVSSNGSSSSSTESSTDDAATPEAPENNYVVVSSGSMNGEFLKGWGNSSYDANIRKLVFGGASTSYGGLLIPDNEGKYVLNSITESWDVEEDGLVHIFKLKDGLVYSDGETTLTADDVVFTYNFYLDEEALLAAGGSSSLGTSIESVEKVDDLTVKFTLKQYEYELDALFAEHIMSESWAMADKPEDKSVQQHVKDSLISNPMGYGPYKIVEYQENQYVKLEINEYYEGNFRGNKPSIQEVVVKITAEETELDELLTGQLDLLVGQVDEEKIDPAKDAGIAWSNYPRHGYGHLSFHTDYGVVRHKEVRQAIAYTIDRALFRDAFIGSYGMSTDGPYSTNYWMIDEEWVDANLTHYTADAAKVDEILSAEGWAKNADGIWARDGEVLEINIAAGLQTWGDTLNLVLDKTVEDFGIKFNVEVIDFSILLDHYYGQNLDSSERQYHMFALATSLGLAPATYTNWHSDNVNDPWGAGTSPASTRYISELNDELALTMKYAESDEEYQEAYREWVKLMNEEMPIIPLYSNDYHDLYNPRVQGFETNALYDWTAAIVEASVN